MHRVATAVVLGVVCCELCVCFVYTACWRRPTAVSGRQKPDTLLPAFEGATSSRQKTIFDVRARSCPKRLPVSISSISPKLCPKYDMKVPLAPRPTVSPSCSRPPAQQASELRAFRGHARHGLLGPFVAGVLPREPYRGKPRRGEPLPTFAGPHQRAPKQPPRLAATPTASLRLDDGSRAKK